MTQPHDLSRTKDLLAYTIGVYRKHLILKEDDGAIVEAVLSTIVANMHPTLVERVWLHIVGPPSSMKTECLRPYDGHPLIVSISSLTENSLISGYRDETGADPSLVLLLHNKIGMIKDLTALLKDQPAKIDKIFGDLRDLFDGYCSKASGTRGLVKYQSSFGMITCVTDFIDSYMEQHQQLGERFLMVRTARFPLSTKETLAGLACALSNLEDKKKWRALIRTDIHNLLDHIVATRLSGPLPSLDTDATDFVLAAAHLLALLRTAPIDERPVEAEQGFRIMQQLHNLGMAHTMLRGAKGWGRQEQVFLRRILLDTLTPTRKAYLLMLYLKPRGLTIDQLITLSRTSAASVRSINLQYNYIGVVRCTPLPNGTFRVYLEAHVRSLLDRTKLFAPGPHIAPLRGSKNTYASPEKEKASASL